MVTEKDAPVSEVPWFEIGDRVQDKSWMEYAPGLTGTVYDIDEYDGFQVIHVCWDGGGMSDFSPGSEETVKLPKSTLVGQPPTVIRYDILKAALVRLAKNFEDGESFSGTQCQEVAQKALLDIGMTQEEVDAL